MGAYTVTFKKIQVRGSTYFVCAILSTTCGSAQRGVVPEHQKRKGKRGKKEKT